MSRLRERPPPVHVFVSEWVSGGGLPLSEAEPSLLREGSSMLCAVLADLLTIPECRLTTTRAAGLPALESSLAPFLSHTASSHSEPPRSRGHDPAECLSRLNVVTVQDPQAEQAAFLQLARQAERVLPVAPETGSLLTERIALVQQENPTAARFLPTAEAIALCTDKLELTRFLHSAGVPVIPAEPLCQAGQPLPEACPLPFPIVIKPRDGAGCLETHVVHTAAAYQTLAARETAAPPETFRSARIIQPWIEGTSLSAAAIVDAQTGEPTIFPLGRQQLVVDSRIRYTGGRIPAAELSSPLHRTAARLIRHIIRATGGLRGYLGFDLIQPATEPEKLLLVEINPRLTTAWLGYRQLVEHAGNLAAAMAGVQPPAAPCWREKTVSFSPVGIHSPSSAGANR